MITPDTFRPLPKQNACSPFHGMSRSLDLLSGPFDLAGKIMRGLTWGMQMILTRRSGS